MFRVSNPNASQAVDLLSLLTRFARCGEGGIRLQVICLTANSRSPRSQAHLFDFQSKNSLNAVRFESRCKPSSWLALSPYSLCSLRRGWDSNPRYPCGYSGFQDQCLQPLSHLSKFKILYYFNSKNKNLIYF